MEREKILAAVEAEDFVGRARERDALLQHARGGAKTRGLLLSASPGAGASELLKQIYDQFFFEQIETIPFYFSLKNTDKTSTQAAARFLQAFLQQTVAFRRQDAKILDASPDVYELSEIAAPSDGYWIDRLIETCRTESKLPDERAFVKSCLSAPLRAAAHGAKTFVIFDNLHEAGYFSGTIDFAEEIKEIYSRAAIQFVLAGKRRFLFDLARTGNVNLNEAGILPLEPLAFSDAGLLAEKFARRYEVEITEQTRDLIAAQWNGEPNFIKSLFQAANAKRINLDSFQSVERVYTDELFGGRLGKFYDSIIERIAPNVETQKSIVGLLYDSLTIEKEKAPIEAWQNRVNQTDEGFYRTMRLLNDAEIVRATSNHIEAMTEREVLTDYIKARFRLEIMAENRALVVGEALSEFLKRAPQAMAKFYRRASAIGLRELLSVFDCQETPVSLLDYSLFSEKHKGAETTEIFENIKIEKEKINLPQVVYAAHAAAFYPPINQVSEKERSAVALGFQKCTYTDEDETVWLAAEIDSKLEASKEKTEFWCDRLEMVALMCNFLNYKLWLVAPEGFSPEAQEILRQRNAFGSSRKQVELLIKFLNAEEKIGEKLKPNEYEMVVPMGEDTELIAAHAVEEIARRHSFAPKAINQIKTALVEACINATEHSHSPDRRIYQKFSVENDKIVITISNRGLRLTDKTAEEITPDEGRRGWGLKLMKTLMDEVKFEQVDDGTRISMTKYLKK